jgi:hypothetical protein
MASEPFYLLRELVEAESETERVFRETIEQAGALIAAHWVDPEPFSHAADEPRRPERWPAFEARYPTGRHRAPTASAWGSAVFQWAFGVAELRRDRPGEAAFAAGVIAPLDARDSPFADAHWLAERERDGFEHLRNARLRVERAVRWLYPDELMVQAGDEEQARVLADWVVETFEELAARPPEGQ